MNLRIITHIRCDEYGNVKYVKGIDGQEQEKNFGPIDVKTILSEIDNNIRLYCCQGSGFTKFISLGSLLVIKEHKGLKYLIPEKPEDFLNLDYF